MTKEQVLKEFDETLCVCTWVTPEEKEHIKKDCKIYTYNKERELISQALDSQHEQDMEESRKKVEGMRARIAIGLVSLVSITDGFPPEIQWKAAEAHTEIIIYNILDLIK